MALNVQFTNNATSTLASGILVGDTSLTVQTGAGALFPTLTGSKYFYCTLLDSATSSIIEIVKVTARSGDTFTIVRAQEGTTASAYSAGDKVELRLTSAGLNAISTETITTLTSTENTFTSNQNIPSINNGALGGFHNRIINGGMSIDQVNEGASQTYTAGAAIAYCVDQWYGSCVGANVTGQQVAGTAPNQYAYRFTGAASVTSILFGQRIESIFVSDLVNKDVCIQATLSNSLLTSVTWTAYYANSTDNFSAKTQIATGTITVNSTPTDYAVTFNAGANAANGIAIEFSVGAQTSGTWTISGVMLKPGVAIIEKMEKRAYELPLCLRYTYVPKIGASSYDYVASGYALSTTQSRLFLQFPVRMRTTPTLGYNSITNNFCIYFGASSAAYITALSLTAAGTSNPGSTPDAATLTATVASGLTAGDGTHLGSYGDSTGRLYFFSRL